MISREAFKPDCQNWDGYKPCPIQKLNEQPDCLGCEEYEPAPAIIDKEPSTYTPEILKEAKSIGLIEMDGLGSVLRTTVISKAIRNINPDAKLVWFTSAQGADLLQYAPGVTPINLETLPPEEYA